MSDQQIEEFLAKEPKVPVKFNQDVQGLGKYIGTAKSNNLFKLNFILYSEIPFTIFGNRYKDSDLAEILIKSKKARSLEIFDSAKRIYEDHNEFIEKLDDGEQL
ncbi:2406_t:CDS:2, partial [Scutellospora calospora]